MNAVEIVERVVKHDSEALIVASLGTATSALRRVTNDGPHLYLAGAMGSAIAVALGVADAQPEPVVAVVGDGELMMGASSLWSLAGIRPHNLTVVVLADERYSITGLQPLIMPCTAAGVASALGMDGRRAAAAEELDAALREASRPAVIEAVVDDRIWPGRSPFVDPHRVRLQVSARFAR